LPVGTKVRNLTLNEDFDDFGRLIQREGTDVRLPNSRDMLNDSFGNNNQGLPTWGRGYLDDPTEKPAAGAMEVWNIYNLTGDTHPIHFHLVNVQIIQRTPFDGDPAVAGIGGLTLQTPRSPDANEIGWKETVRMNPNEVTTVIMQFNLPKVPFTVNPSISAERGINGNEYVWHCHILEHEEHDMMRPLVVIGPYPLAVVPEEIVTHDCKDVFQIVNGVPPYTITTDDIRLLPIPPKVNSNGGKFAIFPLGGVLFRKDHLVTLKIKDSKGHIVTAKVTIDKKPYAK
jgi:hypothetical protein